MPLRLFVVKPVEERERELRHPVVDAIRARPEHLPDAASLTAPLHRWRRADLAPFMPALRRVARRRPRGLARAFATASAQASATAARRSRARARSTSRSCCRRSRSPTGCIAAPDVRHLHAHFAHGTTTITWHAARIAGLPFSFTGHARDIYAEHLNPKGWLRRKLLAARFVVTCTGANVRHLQRDRPGGGRPPRLPRAQRRLRAHARRARAARRRARHAARPRRRPPGGEEGLRRPGRRLRRPAPPRRRVRGGDRRPGGQALDRGARADRRPRPRGPRPLPGPMGQDELLREYRRASALCMPSRLLPDDRDGIPNVLVEAMAAGTPVIASAVSGIPELVEHEVNGLLVAPEDPEALADTLLRLHGDPAFSRDARAQRARDGRAPLRRPAAGEPARRAVPGGGPGMTGAVARRPRPVLCVTEHEHRSREIADGVLARALHGRGRDARARHRPGLARRRPPRRRGVADRVGQVRVGPRPRPRRGDRRRA